MKKYEFTGETKIVCGVVLHRIKAVASFGNIEAGKLGGWIEKEENLDHDGNAWVYADAKVFGNAWVGGNAKVYADATICGNAKIFGDSHYLVVGPIGSRRDLTTFFRTENLKIGVKCGCFYGNIDEFSEKVKKTHGNNEHARKYLAAINFAKTFIDLPPGKKEEQSEGFRNQNV